MKKLLVFLLVDIAAFLAPLIVMYIVGVCYSTRDMIY